MFSTYAWNSTFSTVPRGSKPVEKLEINWRFCLQNYNSSQTVLSKCKTKIQVAVGRSVTRVLSYVFWRGRTVILTVKSSDLCLLEMATVILAVKSSFLRPLAIKWRF